MIRRPTRGLIGRHRAVTRWAPGGDDRRHWKDAIRRASGGAVPAGWYVALPGSKLGTGYPVCNRFFVTIWQAVQTNRAISTSSSRPSFAHDNVRATARRQPAASVAQSQTRCLSASGACKSYRAANVSLTLGLPVAVVCRMNALRVVAEPSRMTRMYHPHRIDSVIVCARSVRP